MAGDDDYLRCATSINHQVALRANFKMYSRSAKGGEKGDPNRNPWLAKMGQIMISAKKSNGVKNVTNNMYKNTNSKEKKMVVSYSYNIL